MNPVVRYLIVCEDILRDADQPLRVSLVGLLSAIRSIEEPFYPLLYREFCVFLQMTECRGAGDAHIQIKYADSDEVIVATQPRAIKFVSDPLDLNSIVFRIRNCLFPKAGLYLVQFWYNHVMIAEQPLVLR